ncbi:MAG: putative DNA binding domain-containing protein [Dehalococcoidales bacterium]|nr:putative DNA binding domain-containing protein [Dehalococcoidales bacterium]
MSAFDEGEGQQLDFKSLRKVTGKTADFAELACDCVGFANAAGGRIVIGVEDGKEAPPHDQQIESSIVDTLRKRIGELTVNVTVVPELRQHENGGAYVSLFVQRSLGVASTSDGRYFVRVGDTCRPVVGDEVLRLADERPTTPWETMTSLAISAGAADRTKVARLIDALRASERVKPSVKEKSDGELLEHYLLSRNGVMTNLGVLLVGTAADRARLGTAPIVQAIRYDDRGVKVAKYVWDDHTLSPIELLDAIWSEISDFRETYELPAGMFRTTIPAFDEAVVRELLVNAFVHRPYTQRGDVFLNLRPDSLEVVNPGRLPLGVTPHNVLHESRRRNEALARVFHDIKLMEREGSGIDLIFESLVTSGRPAPTVREGADSVHVLIPRRVVHPGVARLLSVSEQRFQLTQRERITLGLLAQGEGLRTAELTEALALSDAPALKAWVGRLVELGLLAVSGRTRAARYFVPPGLLQSVGLDRQTTLTRVQPHRLRALVLEDLERYPGSARGDIHRRVGAEIHVRSLSRVLAGLVQEGEVVAEGKGRWCRYRLKPSMGRKE